MQPTLVILAAGMGSRYGGLKQLDPIGPAGETMMDYAVYDAVRAGFGKLVFVIRASFEADFRAQTEARYGRRITVDYAHQRLDDLPNGFVVPDGREKPWGTAHAVYGARHAVAGPFAVINADDFYGADSFRVLAERLARPDFAVIGSPDRYAMVGFTLRKTLSEHGAVSRGICDVNPDGALHAVEELTGIVAGADGCITGRDATGNVRQLSGAETVSMNMWGFPPALFDRIEKLLAVFLSDLSGAAAADRLQREFYMPSVVNTLMRQGRADVQVLASGADWFGITYRDDRPVVVAAMRMLIERGVYPEALWASDRI